jgi:signal transduction histidine kinase
MSASTRRRRAPYIAAVAWLVFTVSLASWWLAVGLTLTNRHRMFLWEGTSFIVVLVCGGVAILVALRREDRRQQALEMFFMSFTHDLKTSLASVQLQAEGLREDHGGDEETRQSIDRLLEDVVRLQIQLENSLFVAQPDGRLLAERVDVRTAVERQRDDWPGLAIVIEGDAAVRADARAFDTVLRNLLQNAVLHGRASQVTVSIARTGDGTVRIVVADNGQGPAVTDLTRLGEAFLRPGPTSGTGVGLHVSRRLIARMGGTMDFALTGGTSGALEVTMTLPEAA